MNNKKKLIIPITILIILLVNIIFSTIHNGLISFADETESTQVTMNVNTDNPDNITLSLRCKF